MDQNTGGTPTTVSSPVGYLLNGKLILSGIAVLFAIVILILLLHLYVRWHVLRRHDRRRRRNRLIFAASAEEGRDHPAPRGLDKEVLSSLPTEIFSDRDGAEDAECAVCLDELDEGEKVRVLPRCGHRFHVDCIDLWFGTHSTCPLCRCAVEAVKPPAPSVESGEDSATVSDPNPIIGEVRIEIPEESGSSTSTEVCPVKLPGHRRISSIRRFFIGDVRVESTDRASPPPPPPPPPATAQ